MTDGAILVGDGGGTNVRFALARRGENGVSLSDIWKRPGADFATFDAALDAFLAETRPKLAGAAFGLAGAVVDGRVELLHRNWVVDRAALRTKLQAEGVVVVNDFVAMARVAPELSGDSVRMIHEGRADPAGSIAVGGPGTGFGVAVLRRIASGWVVVGGEGGHQAFAPATEIEWKLAEKLRKTEGYVSNETVASGSGFDATRAALAEVMGLKDPGLSQVQVSEAAEKGDPFAQEFCRIRARTVMTAMGNTTLAANATGGVFIAGGVSVHLEAWLKERTALDRFYRRGPRSGLMKPIPISLITSEAAPLMGAAFLWRDEQERGWL